MGSPYCANMLLLYKRRMDMISREPNKSERKLYKPNNPPKQAEIKKRKGRSKQQRWTKNNSIRKA
jgi:hypothetical protein